jgi:hypothetical protein
LQGIELVSLINEKMKKFGYLESTDTFKGGEKPTGVKAQINVVFGLK